MLQRREGSAAPPDPGGGHNRHGGRLGRRKQKRRIRIVSPACGTDRVARGAGAEAQEKACIGFIEDEYVCSAGQRSAVNP